MRKTLQALVAALALLSISLPAFSQANQGTIQGSVFDQTGGAIAGATVTITDVARGVSRTLTSDTAGLYVAPNLTPGMYSIKGEAKGFQTLQRSNVVLETGQTVRIDLTLQPGAQEQTVTVTSEAPQIDTSDATLGGTINQQVLTSLPMNGRDFKNLTQLQPGVTAYQGGGIDSWSANGTRAEDVGYLVDGLRMDEAYTGNSVVNSPMPAGDAATGLPVDAIQEINNQANPKAEAGWKPGSIVNIGIKSGTNTLHGTAFAYGRDTSFDARNPFLSTGQGVGLEQFGGNLGGRIIKDKLFWFADYEGLRYTVDSATSATSPATVSLGGCTIGSATNCGNPASSLVDACLALVNGGSTISPLSAQFAGLNPTTCAIRPTSYTPGSGESLFPANISASPIYFNLPNVATENNGLAKVDYHLNDKHTISGTYFYGTGGITTPPNFGAPNIPTTSDPFAQNYGATAQLATGAWNWAVSSTKINEFRLGYDRFNQDYHSIDENVNPLAYGFNTGATDPRTFGFPAIKIKGFSSFGGSQHKVVGPDGSLQALDHFSIVRGAHTFKFGGEFINNTVNSYQNNGGKGTFSFQGVKGGATALENLLAGNVKATGNSILVGNPTRQLGNQDYALFAQDDWRATRKVIVNLGLRWEYNSVLTEAHNLIGNFDPTRGLVQVGQQINSPINGDFRNFSPRLGVAWDVRGDGKTVVRAGASLMYSYLPIISYAALAQSLGLTLVPTGATIVTQGACAAGCPGAGGASGIGVVRAAVPGSALTTGWKNQSAACVSGGTTACGTIFPTSTLGLKCGDGVATDPSPCITLAMDPNYRTSQIDTWTLGVQRAITNTLALNVSYVGTHGARLEGLTDINRAALGSGFTAAQLATGDPSLANTDPTAQEQPTRPYYSKFPYLADINWQASIASSNYNALEVTLTQRVWHGLNFLAGYTYSHGLDDASTNSFSTVPADGVNPALMYASSDFDIRNRFTLSASYAIPGKKSPAQLLQGWQISSVVTLQSGMPWSPRDTTNDFSGAVSSLFATGADYYGANWNFVGNPADFTSTSTPMPCWKGAGGAALPGCSTGAEPQACVNAAPANSPEATAIASVGCYVSLNGRSVLLPPALGTFGNAGRNMFRDSGFKDWDLSITKDWKFRERYDAQFKAEIFNLLNTSLFANPGGIGSGAGFNDPSGGISGQFGCGCVTPDQASPNPVLGAGSARAMQLGLKLTF